MQATLLVELLTEELPPKALASLSLNFERSLFDSLVNCGLAAKGVVPKRFATPRRLAVLIPAVHDKAPDARREVLGPTVMAGLDAKGDPTPALTGFAKKNGIGLDQLEQVDSPKGKVFVARVTARGAVLDAVLAGKVEEALRKLPIPKLMRWGDGEAQFVRPVHKLVMVHGARVLPGCVLGLSSGNVTRGHRFMSSGDIVIANADAYEAILKSEGRVIPGFAERRAVIEEALLAEAGKLGANLGDYRMLLDEVAALVEHPSVYAGEFDPQFLEVPQECLILTMRQNQKYFPLFAAAGKLLPKFLIVSNMQTSDPRHIVGGNQRVVRPRLEDARFFYTQDKKTRLEARVPQLGRVIYHNKLGSQLERTERVQLLAGKIARAIGADAVLAERAAWLSKADLLTDMVGEFPELQGKMGRYYALHDGEPATVADAIDAHYRPRFAGDDLPEGPISLSVALADKLETLVGIFGIGAAPTGDKDPFALRRQALGVLRILIEAKLPLEIDALLADAVGVFTGTRLPARTAREVYDFLLERLRNWLREQGHPPDEIEAVVSQSPTRIDLIPARLEAVKAFRRLPEAKDLAAANKRVLNIIRKNEELGYRFSQPDRKLMGERAEIALMDAVARMAPAATEHFDAGDYAGNLRLLAQIKPDVDRFFDEVMVMVEDAVVRNNRAALLQQLSVLMNRVADISKLAP